MMDCTLPAVPTQKRNRYIREVLFVYVLLGEDTRSSSRVEHKRVEQADIAEIVCQFLATWDLKLPQRILYTKVWTRLYEGGLDREEATSWTKSLAVDSSELFEMLLNVANVPLEKRRRKLLRLRHNNVDDLLIRAYLQDNRGAVYEEVVVAPGV